MYIYIIMLTSLFEDELEVLVVVWVIEPFFVVVTVFV